MGEEKTKSGGRSIVRLLLFEALALGGYLYLQNHPMARPLWGLNFRIYALAFLAAYPLFFIYRWKVAGGCLGLVFWPIGYALSLALGISCYAWLTLGLYYSGSIFYGNLTKHEIVFVLLFGLVYFPLLEPVLGVSKKNFSFPQTLWILLFSVFGGFLGYLLGDFMIRKAGTPVTDKGNLFLLWILFILIGAAVGAMGAQRNSGE